MVLSLVVLLAADGVGLAVRGNPSRATGPILTSTGPVIVRLDDRTIVVQATDDGPDCNRLPTLSAQETTTSVALSLTFPPPPSGNVACAGVGLSAPESVTVPSPIGPRSVLDRSTGRPVSITDERALPQISVVPTGHQAGALVMLDPDGTGPHAIGRLFPTTTSAADTIEVDTWQGNDLPRNPSEDPVTSVEVSGHHATLIHIPGEATVVSSRLEWIAYGQVIEVQTRPDGAPARAAVNDAAVIALARSITAPFEPFGPASP